MTAAVKDELCAVSVTKASERITELSTVLRCVAQLHASPGGAVLQAEVDRRQLAARIHRSIRSLYGYNGHIATIRDDTETTGGRYYVRVTDHAADLARRSGFTDHRGRPVRGLSARTVARTNADTTALVRGAFLAGGHLEEPRASRATISCPTFEAAVAVVGALRRLDIPAALPDSTTRHVITVRRPEAIGELLARIGAPHTARIWLDRRAHGERRPLRDDGDIATLAEANSHRARHSAAITAQRVRRAFDILGDKVPAHLVDTGRLRVEHPEATIDQLGRLADPPATKDTVAGRIRRLLTAADAHARATGVADTNSAVTPQFLTSLLNAPPPSNNTAGSADVQLPADGGSFLGARQDGRGGDGGDGGDGVAVIPHDRWVAVGE